MLIPFDGLWKRHGIRAPGVVHIGANDGVLEAALYHKLGVRKVIWIEAEPVTFGKLKATVAKYPNDICLQACVSDVDGQTVKFHIANNASNSSSMLEFGSHTTAHPDVTFIDTIELVTTRVDTLFKKHNIQLGNGWFINCDVQGAELLALKGCGELLWHFDYAYVEVNERELYKLCPLTKDIDAYLDRFGFVGIEERITPQFWGDKFYKRWRKP